MAETENAVFKLHIEGTMEEVFAEITRTDGLNPVFFNMRMDVDRFEVGGQLRMRSGDGKYTGVVGEILEWDPPRLFAHTFKFTQYDDPPCTVRYELEESGDGVAFTIKTLDMPKGTKTAKQMGSGGKMIATVLKAMVENGRPSFGTRMLFLLFKLMEPLTPAKCKSENWP